MEYRCEECKSSNFVRNGKAYDGRQKYYCKDCGYYGKFKPSNAHQIKNFSELAIILKQSKTFSISPEAIKALQGLDKPIERPRDKF